MNHDNAARSRLESTQLIRDLAEDEGANDVDLAAELGRLELEISLGFGDADDVAQRELRRALTLRLAAMDILVSGETERARPILKEIVEIVATYGNRPTEPPASPAPRSHTRAIELQ